MSDWYERSFGEDYLIVYKHRDAAGAYQEVRKMMEWLALPAGSKVLDLCCGMGRHSLALADFGYQVTGLDLSETLLREARKSDDQSRVTWLQGDMRVLPDIGPFDAVVNLFTSFGYFEDDTDHAKVLAEMERIMKPEGKFIIDFLNAEFVKANLVAASERAEGDMMIYERRAIEQEYVCKRITIVQGTDRREYAERVKLFKLEDFNRLFAATQLHIDHVYGNYNGEAFDEGTSPRLILVGHKKGDEKH